MCVIIVRNPKVDIPFDSIKSACTVNGDGFGMSIIDRGKIETVRYYDPKGNDPDVVAKMLEDTKDHRVYLHLRFATRGTKNQDNCHPFDAYTDDEYHVQFMHNGTLGSFGDNNVSDSLDFSQKILKPLIRRTLNEVDNPLQDEFLQSIVKQYAGSTNRFVLFDNNGKDFILGSSGESKWHGNEEWWSSNVYSFNRYHREKTTYDSGYTGGYWKNDVPFKEDVKALPKPKEVKKEEKASTFPKREPIDPTPALTFCDVAGLMSIDEVCDLDEEALDDILDDKDVAKLLFKDLIFELFEARYGD